MVLTIVGAMQWIHVPFRNRIALLIMKAMSLQLALLVTKLTIAAIIMRVSVKIYSGIKKLGDIQTISP
jgi:hypothetical protein